MVKVVAIGTSAGGLTPLQRFFSAAPDQTDVCYVVIQHLHPGFESMMDKLLGRQSKIRIKKIEDGDPIQPNTIYLNSPSIYVEIEGDEFRVQPFLSSGHVPRLPIDHFFISLVQSKHQPIAAVIMSGSGSDGAKGAGVIAQAGGHVFVEDPSEAEFSAMPNATLKAVPEAEAAFAEDLPQLIEDRLSGMPVPAIDADMESTYQSLIKLIHDTYGLDILEYKQENIKRRIARRMSLREIKNDEDYLDLLENDAEALTELYGDVLINVTQFMRDPAYYRSLTQSVFPEMFQTLNGNNPLRIWVPACSTGEEAYSIAIELNEAMEELGLEPNFRIIATDVYEPAIKKASLGFYNEDQLVPFSPRLRNKYFDVSGVGYRIKNTLRQKIIFSVHNVLTDAPFLRLDMVSCRNMLIYFSDHGQNLALSNFFFGLKHEGFLALGPSESASVLTEKMTTIDETWRIFQKSSPQRRIEQPSRWSNDQDRDQSFPAPKRPATPAHQSQPAQGSATSNAKIHAGFDVMLRRYAPSSILVNTAHEVLTWCGSAGLYMDAKGQTGNWTVDAVVHPALHPAIYKGLQSFSERDIEVFEDTVTVKLTETDTHKVRIQVEPLALTPPYPRCAVVILHRLDDINEEDEAYLKAVMKDENLDQLRGRIIDLTRDLRLTEESLQFVSDRLENHAALLRASNQELSSSNEELQASNEELQASNEELHAVNEELQMISSDFEKQIQSEAEQIDTYEFALDMIGTSALFLTHDMRLSSFTRGAGELLELVNTDKGRYIRSVGVKMDFADWDSLGERAMTTQHPVQAEGMLNGVNVRLTVSMARPRTLQKNAVVAAIITTLD